MAIFVMGRPGSGKDTQAKFLTDKFNLEFVDTGTLLLEKFRQKSDDPKVKQEIENFNKGILVDPVFVASVVKEKIESLDFYRQKGVVFTGSPRTVYEAEHLYPYFLNKFGKENLLAVYLDVSEPEAVSRIVKRGKLVLAKNPNDPKAILDNNKEAQKTRQTQYSKRTEPVLNFLKEKGILKTVDGMPPPEKVWELVLNEVKNYFKI